MRGEKPTCGSIATRAGAARRRRGGRGRSRSTGSPSSCGRPRRARSGSSRSMQRCCRGCGTRSRHGPTVGEAPAVLHLFAYTGLATLAMAAAGARVTHVDASRPTVGWARHNAGLSGLAERPIRWIVDDAAAFTGREVRRGRRYAGVVLDPPSYGHGPGAGAWRIGDDLAPLLESIAQLLAPGRLPPAHRSHPGARFRATRRRRRPALSAGRRPASRRATSSSITPDGRRAELGAFARTPGGAS